MSSVYFSRRREEGGDGEVGGGGRTGKNDLRNRRYVNSGYLWGQAHRKFIIMCVRTFLNFPNIYNERVLLT